MRKDEFPPPHKTAWQLRPGANGSWLIKCRHGNEKTNHGEAFALYLWAISHGHVHHGWSQS